ncbi:MAG: hypothetical protein ACOY0T_34625 [Myxococcota bacterium]
MPGERDAPERQAADRDTVERDAPKRDTVDNDALERDAVERAALERERARRVQMRRYKRRLKAAAALMLSLAAGTFLACQKETGKPGARPNPAPNPTTPEISNLPAPIPNASASDPAGSDDLNDKRGRGGSGAGGSGNGGSGSGGGSGGGTSSAGKQNRVDRHEHRKGMPVRDNLVE